jgi:hypothetical protein
VIPYPGAPPTPPYDNAGWTLAFQMGVEFDRVLEGFSGPFEKVTDWNVKPPAGTAPVSGNAFTLTRDTNDSFTAVNRLLAAGRSVGWNGQDFVVTADAASLQPLTSLGVSFKPTGGTFNMGIRPARIALWDQYGGSMDSGWTRWILEQFEFPFTRVYAPDLDAGSLTAKYDVLILPPGAVGAEGGGGRGPSTGSGQGGRGGGAGPSADSLPAEYRGQLGRITAERTIPQIRAFVENGGTVIAISDSAMNLALQMKLPIENHLVENGAAIPRAKFFVPGSVLTAKVDTSYWLAAGMAPRTDVFFDNSPVFKLAPGAEAAGVRAFAWFDSPAPVHSGWAWGQKYLEGGVLAIDASLGRGHVVLYGPEILQRAQPHGTFKLLFNALFAPAAGARR